MRRYKIYITSNEDQKCYLKDIFTEMAEHGEIDSFMIMEEPTGMQDRIQKEFPSSCYLDQGITQS